MNYRMNALAIASLTMVCISPNPAFAQNAAGQTAREIVADRLGQMFTHRQIAVLNLVAHATATAMTCDAIDMNEDAIKGALTAVINETLPDLNTQAERDGFRNRALIGFGALVGQMVDAAAIRQTEFCAKALSEMNEEGAKSFLKPHS